MPPKIKFTSWGAALTNIIFILLKKKKDKDISIVYAGKIADSKGVFQLVHTFKNQLSDEKNINLELYGCGDKEAVNRLTKEIESDHRITYYGTVTQDVLGRGLPKK